MRFIFAPIVFILGLLCMRYTVQITGMTGKIDLAEKYLGGGLLAGTYTWWRLFGLLLCILSVLWIFNLLPHGAPAPAAQPTSFIYGPLA